MVLDSDDESTRMPKLSKPEVDIVLDEREFPDDEYK